MNKKLKRNNQDIIYNITCQVGIWKVLTLIKLEISSKPWTYFCTCYLLKREAPLELKTG